jgi:predicted ATPase
MRAHEAIKRGNLLGHVHSVAMAQSFSLHLHWMSRDLGNLNKTAESILRVATEHNLPYPKVMASIWIARLKAEVGNIAEGVKGVHDGLIAYQNMGYRNALPYFLGLLASAHHKAGEIEEGLRVLDRALSMAEATSDRWSDAELFRVKGELLLAGNRSNINEAEASFLKAIDIARHQSAKTWELRAATSLARLWHDVGRATEAHDVLAPIYGWFTDDLDLPDLKDARALLDELNAGIGKAGVAG